MPISTRVSLIRESPGTFELATVELDDPRQGELTVKLVATGLPPSKLPLVGGHEGAGVVTAVGPNTPGFEVGDHVVFSFLAACGRCEFCGRGMSNLCDLGSTIMSGGRPDEPGRHVGRPRSRA